MINMKTVMPKKRKKKDLKVVSIFFFNFMFLILHTFTCACVTDYILCVVRETIIFQLFSLQFCEAIGNLLKLPAEKSVQERVF